jgi:hypothetical protein
MEIFATIEISVPRFKIAQEVFGANQNNEDRPGAHGNITSRWYTFRESTNSGCWWYSIRWKEAFQDCVFSESSIENIREKLFVRSW